jgi:hypothetical protein
VFLWHFSSIAHHLHVLSDFYGCKLRLDVVSAAIWCHRQFLMSPIDSVVSVFYRRSVDVFCLAWTVEKLFDIFRCAYKLSCKFAFETNFCKFDPCNDPIRQCLLLHTVYIAKTHILSHQAFWYVSTLPRYPRKRLSWKSPLTSPNVEVLWDSCSMRWDLAMRPSKGTS